MKFCTKLTHLDNEFIKECYLHYVTQSLETEIEKPVQYFLGIIRHKQKAKKQEDEEAAKRKPRSTYEQLTDTSWADDDWLEKLENEHQRESTGCH